MHPSSRQTFITLTPSQPPNRVNIIISSLEMSSDLRSQLLSRQKKKEAELETRAREKLEVARIRYEEEQRRKQEEMRLRKVITV